MKELEDYGMELGMDSPITIERLIESHRYLRGLNLDVSEARTEIFLKAHQEAQKYKDENNLISRKDLQEMTIKELFAWIWETRDAT